MEICSVAFVCLCGFVEFSAQKNAKESCELNSSCFLSFNRSGNVWEKLTLTMFALFE